MVKYLLPIISETVPLYSYDCNKEDTLIPISHSSTLYL